MKKIKKGSALTTVILIIFVMSLIGVSVMNLVVYNYRMRSLDLNIRRAEYKNEIIMDKIYEISQNTIITAIGTAKEQAVKAVDKAVQDEEMLYAQLVYEIETVKDEWKNSIGDIEFTSSEMAQESLNMYIDNNLDEKYKNLTFNYLSSGVQNQYEIQLEYNTVFQQLYKYILDRNQSLTIEESVKKYLEIDRIENIKTLLDGINEKTAYNSIMTNVDGNLFIDNKNRFNDRLSENQDSDIAHIKPELSYNMALKKLVLNNEILYKIKGTPTAVLTADFVITIPNFEDVSSLEQKVVKFSNPLIANKALISGGNLNILSGSNVNVNGDAFIKNKIEVNNSDLSITGKMVTNEDVTIINSNITTGIAYYKNLYVMGNKGKVIFNGNVYASDDLEISSSKFDVLQTSGNYYGFNDVTDINSGADDSSCIIINSSDIDASSSITLNNLYLAGKSYIYGVRNIQNLRENYKTGESISVKGNYIAYQTPLADTVSEYNISNVNFGSYVFNNEVIMLNLVNSFVGRETQKSDFDVNHKWRYFVQVWNEVPDLLKIPNITINSVKYMQGVGVGRLTSEGSLGVISAKTTATADPAFKTNCEKEFELQTKYFGYLSDKTEIFGDNGWIETLSNESEIDSQPILVHNGDLNLTGAVLDNYRIVICSGNLSITGDSNFSGVIIAGGDINIEGNVNINSDRNEIINIIAEGGTEDSEVTMRRFFSLFKYDDSGTKYIITIAGNSHININNLIGIINWQKKDWGYL